MLSTLGKQRYHRSPIKIIAGRLRKMWQRSDDERKARVLSRPSSAMRAIVVLTRDCSVFSQRNASSFCADGIASLSRKNIFLQVSSINRGSVDNGNKRTKKINYDEHVQRVSKWQERGEKIAKRRARVAYHISLHLIIA